MVGENIRERVAKTAENFVYSTMRKFSMGMFSNSLNNPRAGEAPIYERQFSPYWIRAIANRQSLVNNSIEEKVHQAFRRGFDNWEKKWIAKCPECGKEFHTIQPFQNQLGEDGEDLQEDEIDFSQERPCPNCGEMVVMDTPEPWMRDYGDNMFREANQREYARELVPENRETSISQSFLQVCKEVARDIQVFDDGWMIFERSYALDEDGSVSDFDFKAVTRAPPFLMRYSTNEGNLGGEFWACLECRAKEDGYVPQKHPGPCDECGNRTYEVYAYMLDGPKGSPTSFYINGEFAHDSEYRPTRLYGLSPIVSLSDETRSLQKMDEWYRIAYEKRRAPRGAIVVSSSNAESVRAWNQEQLGKLNSDPQHIPTMIDDSDSGGNPISWQPLLDSPTDMQNMQMREWFLDRISAKYGVTAVFQSGSAQATGLSQSLEIVVSNRSAERLQNVFEDTFIPAFIGQLGITGWERHLKTPEEEDEQALARLKGQELNNLRTANDIGLDAEWTRNDNVNIPPQDVDAPEEEEGDEGGLGGLFGGPEPEPGESRNSNPSDRPTQDSDGFDPAGQTSTTGGRPEDPNEVGGGPNEPDTPTSDNPLRRGDGTVTTSTAGYGNVTYGGKPAEVIDVMRDVREGNEEDDTVSEKAQNVRYMYQECVEETGGELPNYEKIENSVRYRPDKNYRSFKRRNSGEWSSRVDTDKFVREVYRFVEEQL